MKFPDHFSIVDRINLLQRCKSESDAFSEPTLQGTQNETKESDKKLLIKGHISFAKNPPKVIGHESLKSLTVSLVEGDKSIGSTYINSKEVDIWELKTKYPQYPRFRPLLTGGAN